MTRRLVAGLLIAGLALPLSGGAAAADAAAWYNSAWKYRQKITVNHELVGGSVDGFPMLVKLTGGVFQYAQPDGADILFTAADGTTKLLHEIESMNGEVVAWVQMPNLSEIQDTVLYVYYGNPAAENQQQATNVWGNGYVGVWHLNETAANNDTGAIRDSSSAGSHATATFFTNDANSTTDADGRIGGADSFSGVRSVNESKLTFSTADSNKYEFGAGEDITVEAWINTPSAESWMYVISNEEATAPRTGFELAVNITDGKPYFGMHDTLGPLSVSGLAPNTVADGRWHKIVGVRRGDTLSIYMDGVLGNSVAAPSVGTSGASALAIGGTGDNTFFNYRGLIDEARISSVARSGAWIKTEYNNQSGRENFLTIAEPETQSTSTAAASSTSALSSPLIQAINRLFNLAFDRFPTFTEWKFWADRVLAGEKDSFPELLGAMQWQKLFGSDTTGAGQEATTSGPTVEIRNGTNRSGLAGRTMQRVSDAGFSVTAVGNAQDYNREQSKVYVLNHDAYDRAAELGEFLQVPVGLDLPAGERATNADILVVLGADFAE